MTTRQISSKNQIRVKWYGFCKQNQQYVVARSDHNFLKRYKENNNVL